MNILQEDFDAVNSVLKTILKGLCFDLKAVFPFFMLQLLFKSLLSSAPISFACKYCEHCQPTTQDDWLCDNNEKLRSS